MIDLIWTNVVYIFLRYKSLRSLLPKFEKSLAKEAKTNPKKIWKYINSKSKIRTGIGDINIDPSDEKSLTTNNDEEKAQIFADYFSDVFTREPQGDIPHLGKKVAKEAMKEMKIEKKDIVKETQKLKPNKSPGPDGIHPKLIRNLGETIAEPLALIFNKSLELKCIPDQWKQAKICAIYKKGNKKLASNYRPVSLTAIICKLMESIIRNHIVKYMKQNKLFSERQYGFISGRSTSLQLLTVLEEWTKALDMGYSVDCIYMDYKKAFDTVPHRRLLGKLNSYGFTEQLQGWMTSFLTGRVQKVSINNNDSKWKQVESGIPQGSVLGPILFVIYINDLPDIVSSKAFLFADDTKIYRVITREDDHKELQKDLDILSDWSETWLLKFHPDKCKHMKITRNKKEENNPSFDLHNKKIQKVEEEKDIGVTIDSHLTFEKHISEKIAKADSMAYLIRRTFDYLNADIFVPLYKALVRSHLDFANSVWAPNKIEHIEEIEKVQKRATKRLPGMSQLNYGERLKALKLPTLAYRRLRGYLIETFKIIHGYYDKDATQFLKLWTNEAERSSPRGQQFKLYPQQFEYDIRKYSFTVRVTKHWNALPDEIVKAPSINSFKNRLDKFYENSPIMYDDYRHLR